MMTKENEEKGNTKLICPACNKRTLDKEEVMNALSRYRDVYICNDCGTREAFKGDFWGSK